MDREFWLDRWRNNKLGWHLETVNPHLLDFWPGMPVPSRGRVFVPLCGKSLDMAWLARECGHAVVGVELSEVACREFFSENGMEPQVEDAGAFSQFAAEGITLLCGDLFDLDAHTLGPVDGVFDRGSLIALPPEMRIRYAGHMESLLPARPPVLCVTLDYPQQEMAGPPFSVGPEEVESLFGNGYRVECLRDWDVLDESPRFREQGLTALHERVFRLSAL
ncbi:thiopurine S-methyltransferase [Thiohalorhabdus methylotrophus]|uniref:Thiopurine S-methyltransferase n=1 Tax=Thiohalorhabdus methylotrophus TaxID=3242694 RepID=A0ABV4TYH4_9GAMM